MSTLLFVITWNVWSNRANELLDIAQDHVITWYIGLHKRVHALEWIDPHVIQVEMPTVIRKWNLWLCEESERERVDVRRNQLVWLTVY